MTGTHHQSFEQEREHPLNPRASAANAWQLAIKQWFQPFIECFWEGLAKDIDWSQNTEDLSQALHAFTATSVLDTHIVHRLYKVYTKSQQPSLLLVHVALKEGKENTFSEKLFEYCYKTYSEYQLPILPLVVLADDNKNWHPAAFEVKPLGATTLQYNFLSVKLLDYKGQEEKLLNSRNPFETLIAIFLEAQTTQDSPNRRFEKKLSIYKHLLQKGWGPNELLNFSIFLTGMMRLPKDLSQQYHNKVIQLEETMDIHYTIDAEHYGHQVGLKEGIYYTAKNMIAQGAKDDFIALVTGLSDQDIQMLKTIKTRDEYKKPMNIQLLAKQNSFTKLND